MFWAASSYSYHQSLEAFLRYFEMIFLKYLNIAMDGFSYIGDRLLPRLTLTHAPRQTGTLRDPEAIFTRIKNYLSHMQPQD